MRSNYIKDILIYWLIGWVILILGRIGLIGMFLSADELLSQSQFYALAVWNAIRFDFQTLAYIAIIPTLVLITASHIRKNAWTTAFMRWYYSIVYTIVAALTVADLSFYKNFGGHFNITMFDFFNEGPLTLVQTFWEEYPVVWMLVGLVLVFLALWRIRIAFREKRRNYYIAVAWVVFIAVAMRGSVVEFPLQVEDMYVSPSQQLNDCVPNAIYSIKKAWSEKKKAFAFESEEELLRQYGFSSVEEAWKVLGNAGKDLFTIVESLDSSARRQPDIVLVLSESWSGYLTELALHSKDADLLCGMRSHLTEDLLFQNYQSVQNGTIATIENLLISTSFPRVFMSKYRYEKFPTSFATPFLESGYTATFMSGMDEGWENVGIGLKNQGFNNVFKYELLKEHPEYGFNSVGVFDHHLMNSLYEHLSRKAETPRLFVVMTTTNHPPFVYPDDVALPSLSDDFYSNSAFANSRDVEEKYIRGYQYANWSMAQFLNKLKTSPNADNTIVIITGDHNVRTALNYDTKPHDIKSWEHRVPLYVYLPEKLRGTADGSYHCDTEKYGCHYDILPTLAPFAFKPGVKYLNVGQNLLSDTLSAGNTYSYNVESTLADATCMFDAHRRAYARELLLRLYLQEFLKNK